MCGIVGLLVKNEALRPRLGELMVPMLIGMTERGPDSSGMAVFTGPVAEGQRRADRPDHRHHHQQGRLQLGLHGDSVHRSVALVPRPGVRQLHGVEAGRLVDRW